MGTVLLAEKADEAKEDNKVIKKEDGKELRERQKFTKPSVLKRAAHMKAVYVQKLRDAEQNM